MYAIVDGSSKLPNFALMSVTQAAGAVPVSSLPLHPMLTKFCEQDKPKPAITQLGVGESIDQSRATLQPLDE